MIPTTQHLSRFREKAEELSHVTATLVIRFKTPQINQSTWQAQETTVQELHDSLFDLNEGYTWGDLDGGTATRTSGGEKKYPIIECLPLHPLITKALDSSTDQSPKPQSIPELSRAAATEDQQQVGDDIQKILISLDRLIQLRLNLNHKRVAKNFTTRPDPEFLNAESASFEQSIKTLCDILRQIFQPLSSRSKDVIEEFAIRSKQTLNIRLYYNQKLTFLGLKLRQALGLSTEADHTRKRKLPSAPVHQEEKTINPSLPSGIARIESLGRGQYRFIGHDGSAIILKEPLQASYKNSAVRVHRSP